MTEELVLYTNPMSRGRIARWLMEEIGQPYRTEIIGYGEMKGADYRAVNPMGKVPAIRHGDVVVTETAAICAYMADAFPAAGLAPPPGSALRAPYYRWLFFAAGPIEAAVTNKALGFEIPAGKSGMAGYGSFDTVMDTLEQAVTGRTALVGDHFTAGRPVSGLADRLRPALQLHRQAPGIRELLGSHQRPACRDTRGRDRRRADRGTARGRDGLGHRVSLLARGRAVGQQLAGRGPYR